MHMFLAQHISAGADFKWQHNADVCYVPVQRDWLGPSVLCERLADWLHCYAGKTMPDRQVMSAVYSPLITFHLLSVYSVL